MAKLDIHQHVTDTIIAQIEAGTPPWRKPWTGGAGAAALPLRHNGEAYRGINILILWATADQRGYSSERWMTFKQAQELGGTVKKGAKCARSVFYGTFEKEAEKAEGVADVGEAKTRIPFAKCNNVFNADEIESLPDEYYIAPEPARDLGTETDQELETFFVNTGADIVTSDEPRAYYSHATDKVHMPPIRTFVSAARYFGVLGHECVHWSGVDKRLGRNKKHKNHAERAREELCAEIGACILAVKLGVEPDFEQSAAYVSSWLEALKNDKGLIFKAASDAQKAVDFIIDAATATEKQTQEQVAA